MTCNVGLQNLKGLQAPRKVVKDEGRTEEEEEDEEQVGGMTSAESDYSEEDEEAEEEDQREVKERKREGKLEWDSSSMKY